MSMDSPALDRLAVALGVIATLAAGAWWYTQSDLAGVVTIVGLVAVIGALLVQLSRPLPNEPRES